LLCTVDALLFDSEFLYLRVENVVFQLKSYFWNKSEKISGKSIEKAQQNIEIDKKNVFQMFSK
jgi:hypothetical protein